MGYELKIPDWKPLDFSAFGDLPQIYQAARSAKLKDDMERQNAETQKRYADNQDRKINHEITRQMWEDQRLVEKDKYEKAKERASMAHPGSPVIGAARVSPQMGNIAGAPYDMSFETQTDKPPSVAPRTGALIQSMFPSNLATDALAGKPAPEVDRHGNDVTLPPLQGPPETLSTDFGDVQLPIGYDQHRKDPPWARQMQHYGSLPLGAVRVPGTEPTPESADSPEAISHDLESQAPPVTHLFMKSAGQRFEVPGAKSNYFAEPKYNDMVQQMMDSGMSEKDAIARADHTRQVDIGQGGLAARAAANLAQKQDTQLTRAEQLQARADALAQSGENSRGRDRAIVTAAGLRSPMVGGGGDGYAPVDPKVLNSWLAVHKEGKASGLAKQAVTNKQLFDRISTELDQGLPPNAESQAMALHSLAVISTSMGSSAGGRLAVQTMRDIKEAPGLIDSAENKVYRTFHHGQNMPSVVKVIQDAKERLRVLSEMERETVYDAVDQQSGTKSGFSQDPGLHRPISDAMKGFRMELGLDPVDDGQGAPAAPPMAPPPAQHTPRHHARLASPPAAGPPPQQLPPTMTTPDGKVYKLDTATGKYH